MSEQPHTDFWPGQLDLLGWTSELAKGFAEPIASGHAPGRVGRVDRGECDVFVAGGQLRVLSDSQRSQGALAPATGDWVAIADDADLGPVIHEILPRQTAIVRRDPSERIEEQVLVANVDLVGVVQGLDHDVNTARLERFLVLAWDSGAEPVIVLTKADLVDDPTASVEAVKAISDVPIIVTAIPHEEPSTGSDETTGSDGTSELRELIGERTLVLIGPSGAGKSTLVNRLVGDQVQETAEVRDVDAKGRHTTVTRDLIPIPGGGVLIDTPGVRAVGVWAADVALDRVFADIADRAAECRFGDCTHRSEPGCAVIAALDAGEIDPARLDRYHLLWGEITEQAEQAEQRNWSSNRRRSR